MIVSGPVWIRWKRRITWRSFGSHQRLPGRYGRIAFFQAGFV